MSPPPDDEAGDEGLRRDTQASAVGAEAERRLRTRVYDDALVQRIARPLNVDPDPDFPEGEPWYLAEAGAAITAAAPPRPAGLGPVGKARFMAQRVTRRTLRSYVEPILARVTSHNRSVLRILADHERRLAALEQRSGGAEEDVEAR